MGVTGPTTVDAAATARAEVGFKVGFEELEHMPLEVSSCWHRVEHPDTLGVPDAGADARFRDQPVVTGARGRERADDVTVVALHRTTG